MSLNNRKASAAEKIQKQDLRILLKLSPFIKPYKKIAVIALMALIVTSLSFLLFGQGIQLFIDEGINKWVGNKNDILDVKVKELHDFIYVSKFLQQMKK